MWKTALCLIASLTLHGCSEVTSPYPMGEKEVELTAEEWNGTWLTPEGGVFIVTVLESHQGLLEVTWIDEENEELILSRGSAFVRESSKWVFLSLGGESGEQVVVEEYLWFLLKKNGDALILWGPDTKKFARLVKDGLLPGTIDSGDVHLGDLDAKHYELIVSEQQGVLFEWDQPLILRRIDN